MRKSHRRQAGGSEGQAGKAALQGWSYRTQALLSWPEARLSPSCSGSGSPGTAPSPSSVCWLDLASDCLLYLQGEPGTHPDLDTAPKLHTTHPKTTHSKPGRNFFFVCFCFMFFLALWFFSFPLSSSPVYWGSGSFLLSFHTSYIFIFFSLYFLLLLPFNFFYSYFYSPGNFFFLPLFILPSIAHQFFPCNFNSINILPQFGLHNAFKCCLNTQQDPVLKTNKQKPYTFPSYSKISQKQRKTMKSGQ